MLWAGRNYPVTPSVGANPYRFEHSLRVDFPSHNEVSIAKKAANTKFSREKRRRRPRQWIDDLRGV
jgi:hypothetical protein